MTKRITVLCQFVCFGHKVFRFTIRNKLLAFQSTLIDKERFLNSGFLKMSKKGFNFHTGKDCLVGRVSLNRRSFQNKY